MPDITYRVTGLGCQACVKRVEQALAQVQGVKDARVDLAAQTVTVRCDGAPDFDALRNAVDEAGYGLETI